MCKIETPFFRYLMRSYICFMRIIESYISSGNRIYRCEFRNTSKSLGFNLYLVLCHYIEQFLFSNRLLVLKIRNYTRPLDLLILNPFTLEPANNLLCRHSFRHRLSFSVRPLVDDILHPGVEHRSKIVVLLIDTRPVVCRILRIDFLLGV